MRYHLYMTETFVDMLAVGGKTNSLGRAAEVVDAVLNDKSRLDELYNCVFHDDAWVRMRAIDSLEKVCRIRPDWIEPYIDKFQKDLATSTQASIQWHLAEIFGEIRLTPDQKRFAVNWLAQLLSTVDIDWIVAANSMKTLVGFTNDGAFPKEKMIILLNIQQNHKSNAVIKRANKLLSELTTQK